MAERSAPLNQSAIGVLALKLAEAVGSGDLDATEALARFRDPLSNAENSAGGLARAGQATRAFLEALGPQAVTMQEAIPMLLRAARHHEIDGAYEEANACVSLYGQWAGEQACEAVRRAIEARTHLVSTKVRAMDRHDFAVLDEAADRPGQQAMHRLWACLSLMADGAFDEAIEMAAQARSFEVKEDCPQLAGLLEAFIRMRMGEVDLAVETLSSWSDSAALSVAAELGAPLECLIMAEASMIRVENAQGAELLHREQGMSSPAGGQSLLASLAAIQRVFAARLVLGRRDIAGDERVRASVLAGPFGLVANLFSMPTAKSPAGEISRAQKRAQQAWTRLRYSVVGKRLPTRRRNESALSTGHCNTF